MAKPKRFETLLPPKIDEDFDFLVHETRSANRAEVFRRAMITYKNMIEAKKRGDFYFRDHKTGELQRVVTL